MKQGRSLFGSDMNDVNRQLRLINQEIAIREAKDDFNRYMEVLAEDPRHHDDYTRTKYQSKIHHQYLARVFEGIERGDYAGKIVLISLPPRSGKTHEAKAFVSWYEGRNPDKHLIYATYNDDLATDTGADVRDVMRDSKRFKEVFPDFQFRKGQANAGFMRTKEGGEIRFTGRRGSITGRGGDILLFDDLLKDDKEAASTTIREDLWVWFKQTFLTRVMSDDATIVGIGTRWHEDDHIGRLVDPMNICFDPLEAERIVEINIPAIAEEDDPLGREPGEVLWPERFSKKFLERKQANDPRGFAALYQGKPTPEDGDFFKRKYIRYYAPKDLPPLSDLRIFAASDHAVSEAQKADFTCLLIVGVDANDDVYLLDCVWDRLNSLKQVEKIIDLFERWKPQYWWAEKGHISKSLLPILRKRQMERGVYGTIEEHTPVGDKTQRAQSIKARIEMGKLYFPKNAPWTTKAVEELMKFPGGTYDDFVDAVSWIGLHLVRIWTPRRKAAAKPAAEGTFNELEEQEKRAKAAARRRRWRRILG